MRTRTTAALVLGCQHFDPQVPIRGVILNQIARPRHEAIIRQAIETYCGIPVLGAIPRLKCAVFPERHMGLVPPQEHATAMKAVTTARDLAQRYLDLEGLWQVASQAPPLPEVPTTPPSSSAPIAPRRSSASSGTPPSSFIIPRTWRPCGKQGRRSWNSAPWKTRCSRPTWTPSISAAASPKPMPGPWPRT